MNINANSFHPLLREIQQLAAHMDQNVLAGPLLVRSASPGFAPSNLQLRIPNFFDDVFQSDIECGASAPWYMVEGASPKECRYALIHALQHISLPRHLLEHLRSSIDSAAIDEIQLGKLVHLLSHLPANPQLLSQVYEANMAAAIPSGGPIPGDFYTPASIVRQIAEMLELKEGSLYDPCCGSGAMLYSTALSLPHGEQLSLFGQASDTNTYQLCQINAILHGLAVDLGGQPADVLNRDLQNGRYFDYILANPSFNLSNWCEGLSPCDERLKYGLPPRSNANYMWLQHIIHHLAPNGRSAVMMPNGSLTTQQRAERAIRHGILQDGLVEAIIALPPRLFHCTRIPCCIWVLSKARVPGATTLLVDISKANLSDNHGIAEAPALVNLVIQHRKGLLHGKTDWYAVVTPEEIALQNEMLSPNLYTASPPMLIEPLRQNRWRFMEVLHTLNGMLSGLSIVNHISCWGNLQPAAYWKQEPLLSRYHVLGGISRKMDDTDSNTALVDVRTVIHHMFLPPLLEKSVRATSKEIETFRIHPGDILMNRTSETVEELACCSIATAELNAVYGSFIKRLRPNNASPLHSGYMAAYLRSAIYRQEVRKVSPVYTTRANMNLHRLQKISIYYPDASMQKQLGETALAVSQFYNTCRDEALRKLLRQFIQLLIEQYVTYPILCSQQEGVDKQ